MTRDATERGEYLRREKDNWNARPVFNEQRYTADEDWLDKTRRAFRPGIHYYVGGSTKFSGAALFRFRRTNFGEVKHAGGISPACDHGIRARIFPSSRT